VRREKSAGIPDPAAEPARSERKGEARIAAGQGCACASSLGVNASSNPRQRRARTAARESPVNRARERTAHQIASREFDWLPPGVVEIPMPEGRGREPFALSHRDRVGMRGIVFDPQIISTGSAHVAPRRGTPGDNRGVVGHGRLGNLEQARVGQASLVRGVAQQQSRNQRPRRRISGRPTFDERSPLVPDADLDLAAGLRRPAACTAA